jgi:hypothetical protein
MLFCADAGCLFYESNARYKASLFMRKILLTFVFITDTGEFIRYSNILVLKIK